MRILHVITGLNTGGAEMMLYKLLSHGGCGSHTARVVSLIGDGCLSERIQAVGIRVDSLNMKRGVPSFSAMWRLREIIRQERPDIIQGWMYHGNLAAQLAGLFAGDMPVVWNVRQSLYSLAYEKKGTAAVIRLGRYLSRLPSCIIYNAKISAEQHEALGYYSGKRIIIPNGFDTDVFSPSVEARYSVRSELNLKPDVILIGLIGRYHPMKDHINFFNAASILLRAYPYIHFLLAGTQVDSSNEHLKTIINDLNISANVHLLGERHDISRLNASLDIAVSSSSHAEGFANVIGEAMACGIPCTVTNVGDSAWIIGDTGRVVPPRDPAALAKEWQELIEMGEKERHELGMKARQRVIDNFSIDSALRQYESLYEKVVSLRDKEKKNVWYCRFYK